MKNKIGFRFKVSGFILSIIGLLAPLNTHAAILYLEPSESTHYMGDTFIQKIHLNTEGEYINIAEVHIEYPGDLLEVIDFSNANSVLTLWTEQPSYVDGVISFSGGTPAGYQGWDALLGKIIFRVKPLPLGEDVGVQAEEEGSSVTRGEVKFLESSRVLLNDGKGTEANLKMINAALAIVSEFSPQIIDEWQDEIALDSTTPEPFGIEISKDPEIYGGRYFIIFSGVDKQTGIDHYEVFEYRERKVWENKDAHSPYLLENQELDGIIRVRAVDKAGNEAIVELRPTPSLEENGFPWMWVVIGIIISTGVGYFVYRFLKRETSLVKRET